MLERRAQMMVARKVATGLLCDTYVGKGGRRAKAGDADAVRVYLMNVLRGSNSDFEIRRELLGRVLEWVAPHERAVLLAPAGYFGYRANIAEPGWLDKHEMDRDAVVRYLRALRLRPGLLLAIGVDHASGSRQTFHFVEGGTATRHQELVRHLSSHGERLYAFGGLTFFGSICAEFMSNEQGPMYGLAPQCFDESRDILGRGIDVVLNAAHLEVSCTQKPNASTQHFPFETFFRSVSRSGAACFLAHHHPDVRWPTGVPKSYCYSNWGMFAGKGQYQDWMGENDPVTEITVGQ